MNNPSASSTPFILKSNDSEFDMRKKTVFDQLNALEKNVKNSSLKEPMEVDSTISTERNTNQRIERTYIKPRNRYDTKGFRGKESIFKEPQDPKIRNFLKKMPDFKKNPHKWTKYSLDDVKDEDISDKGNTKAALSFLKELETRKSIDDDNEGTSDELPKKIMFKRSTPNPTQKEEQDPESNKVSFRSSKIVMPEYVVGQKPQKEKKNSKVKAEKGKELKLDHLLDVEDD